MNSRDRFNATMNYQPRDRCPWGEMGFWPETLVVWKRQGMPEDVYLNDFFGFDRLREQINVAVQACPGLPTEVLEQNETYRVVRRGSGEVVKEFLGEHSYRMPQWLSFALQTRKDWEELFLPRLQPETAIRYPEFWDDTVRCYQGRDYPLTFRMGSVFGTLRNWMGIQHICRTIYDDPAWIQEMMDHMVDLIIAVCRRLLQRSPSLRDIDLDHILLWEDMAYKAGPIISPRMFRQFMLEPYKRLTGFIRDEMGVDLIFVDSDGFAEPLLPLWIEGGVNGFYPIERASDMDAVHLRERFGRDLRLMGGIDKRAMIAGPAEIDAELAHVAPLCAEGGFIPWCDHHVPPDVPLANYQVYVQRMKEMSLDPLGFKRRVEG